MQFPGSSVKACSGESKELDFFDISSCTEFLSPLELPKYMSRAVLIAIIKVFEFPAMPSVCDNVLPWGHCVCAAMTSLLVGRTLHSSATAIPSEFLIPFETPCWLEQEGRDALSAKGGVLQGLEVCADGTCSLPGGQCQGFPVHGWAPAGDRGAEQQRGLSEGTRCLRPGSCPVQVRPALSWAPGLSLLLLVYFW